MSRSQSREPFDRESEFEFRSHLRAIRSALQDLCYSYRDSSEGSEFQCFRKAGSAIDHFLKEFLALETLSERRHFILLFQEKLPQLNEINELSLPIPIAESPDGVDTTEFIATFFDRDDNWESDPDLNKTVNDVLRYTGMREFKSAYEELLTYAKEDTVPPLDEPGKVERRKIEWLTQKKCQLQRTKADIERKIAEHKKKLAFQQLCNFFSDVQSLVRKASSSD